MRWSVLVGWCQRGAAVGRQHSLQAVLALSVMMAAGVAPTRLVGWSAAAGATANDATPVSDLGTHREPALPALPAAGGTLLDSVFGTTLMRLTDASDGSDCRVEYSYWPTFNADSTRAKALCVIGGVNRTKIWDVRSNGVSTWCGVADDADVPAIDRSDLER